MENDFFSQTFEFFNLHDVHASHETGHVKRRQTRLGGRLDAGSVLQQQFDNLDSILFAGYMQGTETVQSPSVHLRSVIQQ